MTALFKMTYVFVAFCVSGINRQIYFINKKGIFFSNFIPSESYIYEESANANTLLAAYSFNIKCGEYIRLKCKRLAHIKYF